jgi:rod shape-determining protein MreC
LVALQAGAERWRGAWLSSAQRQLVSDSLAMRAVHVEALQTENDQLRKIIGLGSQLKWGFVPAEALHGASLGEDLVTTLTLTAGSTSGIRKYDPVVTQEGLVGTIQSADPTMSIAILYTNADFRASAMTADGLTFGIVYPHSARSGGSDAYMLELRGVPTRVNLKAGTLIYTSGLGGTFPRGVTVGSIVQELKTSEVWTRTYLVRPAVTPSRISAVLVLIAQRVTQGTGSVWGATVNADSAVKKIAGAGDSLARVQAAQDAAAKQASMDSLKRAVADSVRRSLGVAVPVAQPDTSKKPAAAAAATRPDSTRRVVRPDSTRRVVRPDSTRRPRTDTTRRAPRPDTTRRDTLQTPRP